ncbi:trans-aconitate 2-methyltransferase [Monaibacterium marinum]|uniref:Trans-aconitate 2-methyltransferase n=1 Tax=Pontivivens marinum TaxID=1690039 RepID=A0A2C9CP82_9RHOB|nr:methyltransferase domain-containing protein [Monaibacterium marinum]SOH93018.1 trans-aconitate 2-methyltransferase [Monaibacterium marinum]
MAATSNDWDAGSYDRFRRLRLRPAMDLLAQVPTVPDGDIVDLGCGSGAAATALRKRFPNRRLIGIDRSRTMLEQAEALGIYDTMHEADIAHWAPTDPVALIFSNAVLHWLPDHGPLLRRLQSMLVAGGSLAIQMPRQLGRPSHDLIYQTAHAMFPERFDGVVPVQVAPPTVLHQMLAAFGSVTVWETEYLQHLPASQIGHPVRIFTQSTAARPVLTELDAADQSAFLTQYDAALLETYPLDRDGCALMPFRRQFAVLTKAGA